jgi:hypothetical protein
VQTNWSIGKGRKLLQTRLLTLSVNGQILYHEFYRAKLTEDFDSWAFDKVHVAVDTLLLKNLNSSINSNDIVVDFGHLERHPYRSTFGYACGAAGTMPEEGERMLKLVQSKDIGTLTSWLKSINQVKQVYSYLGLKLLQATDTIQLTDDIINSMTELENSSTLVYSCSGCTVWDHVTIKSILTKENVTEFLKTKRKN